VVENSFHKGAGDGDGGPEVDSSLAVSVPPRPTRQADNQLKRLTPEALEAACHMHVRGIDAATIAAAIDSTERRVEAALRRRPVKKRLEQLRGEVVLREVQHHFGLHELLPKGRKAIDDALYQGNAKVRSDVGRWLHEVLVGKPTEKRELTVQGRVEHDLSPVLGQIQQHLTAIREANQGRDPLSRVRQGDEVVVRPQLPSGEE